MTAIYVLIYVVIGLIVIKCFQRWVDKDVHTPSLDLGGFLSGIIVWPILLLALIFIGLIEAVIWFYDLGIKK